MYMKYSNKSIVVGLGDDCPKCNEPMERRKHPNHWTNKKSFYYIQWDYCNKCKHVQHYEDFKSSDWKEFEQKEDFIKNISL